MSAPRQQTYDARTFGEWRQERQLTLPYFAEVYSQVAPILEDAGSILDLAGGDGHTQDVMPESLHERLVTADIDERALARLAERYPEAQTVTADAAELPFDDESFDAAVSLSGFGGFTSVPAQGAAKEIERVLKPGGSFVYLQDRPYPLKRFATVPIEHLSLVERFNLYSLPIVSPRTNNVDAFAVVRRGNVHSHEIARSKMGAAALQATEHLLGDHWLAQVYNDEMHIAEHAQHFSALVRAIQANFGNSAASITDPLTPTLHSLQLARFKDTALRTEQRDVRVSHRTPELHVVGGKAIDSLYVDELSLPYIVYRAAESQKLGRTRVQGQTPVYIARK